MKTSFYQLLKRKYENAYKVVNLIILTRVNSKHSNRLRNPSMKTLTIENAKNV